MSDYVDKLVNLPLFHRVPLEQVQAVLPLFRRQRVPAGKRLWSVGDRGNRLGILLSGSLRARVEGHQIGIIRRGDVFGEGGGFFSEGRRTADLVSDEDCRVVLFYRSDLEEMRADHPLVYDAILRECVRALAERVGSTTLALAKLAPGGVHRPLRQERSSLSRIWRAVVSGEPSAPCPPLLPLLRNLPTMLEVSGSVLRQLGEQFKARSVVQGEVLCLEGDPVIGAWLLAHGGVDIVRNVGAARGEFLAAVKVGNLFGQNGLHRPNSLRTASCVASEAGWVYQIDLAANRALKGEAWRVWNESLLHSFIEQVRNSNEALCSLVRGVRDSDQPTSVISEDLA
jgi:CRP-like cAMP-binding protein